MIFGSLEGFIVDAYVKDDPHHHLMGKCDITAGDKESFFVVESTLTYMI